jgi:large subunit ribosomal protein L31
MKKDIHPTFHNDANATCACGSTFAVGSTRAKLEVEICSQCHPFYTGTEKVVDTAGRLEKFNKRRAAAKKTK